MSYGNRLVVLSFLALAFPMSGCLSLGGKTTHVHDNPDTLQRISGLEQRVGILEQALRLSPSESVIPAP
jgi:hypothetical protein